MRRTRKAWVGIAVLAALLPASAAAAPVGTPKVSGPRSTVLERPHYRFQARGAVSFRCAFDSRYLHGCGTRFSQRLFPGRHTLRVRAVGRRRALSRIVTVNVVVNVAYPRLVADRPIAVGTGAGVPTAAGGSVWVPDTETGDLERIDPAAGSVAQRTQVWILSLLPAQILEVDPASGAVRATFPLAPRLPDSHSLIEAWWLAFGDGALWATLPNYGAVARLDTGTHALRYAATPYGRPFGVAVGGGSTWVATDHGVVRLDESTARPTEVALLPAASSSGFASIAFGDGSARFTNYDRGTLTRVSG